MKIFRYRGCALLIGAAGFCILSGCETTGTATSSATTAASTTASANSGRLVVRRIADLGTAAVLEVSVDGKKVGTLVEGQDYNSSLSAGPHVVTVAPVPNNTLSPPPQKRITVVKGQTYAYTAAWKGGALVLQ